MPEEKISTNKNSYSLDWLVRGVLTKLGDIFDRFTGRSWKPSSNLATSELIDRLKILLDREAKDTGDKGVFVPHNIKLKIQWDKFSIDSEDALKKLENELLIAAVDHINDHRYHTYAPLKLEVKPDYFTEGVKLLVGFDNFAEEDSEAAVNVSVPDLRNIVIAPPEEVKIEPEKETFIAEFIIRDKPRQLKLSLIQGERLSVGRTKENNFAIEDGSVSKVHASLVLNKENQLLVADTGSTNGTFINGQRIAYGKAFPLAEGDRLKFGTVDVTVRRVPKPIEQERPVEVNEPVETAAFSPAQDFTTKPTNSAASEDISEEETVLDEKVFLDKENNATQVIRPLEEKSKEDDVHPTEPGIVLDFGENK
jgi:pSer/pThr/pTyr-binding forkhead associated (FHA) protein